MTQLDEIRSKIARLDSWGLAAFATSCAENVAPVFRHLASPRSVAVYDEALNSAWASLGSRRQSSASLNSILTIPEASIDDSNRREYYATLALGVLEYALRSIDSCEVHDSADLACCQALDLYSSFDGIAAGLPGGDIDPASNLSTASLESIENNSQMACLQILMTGSAQQEEILAQLQRESRKSSQALARVLPALIRKRYGA